LRGAYGTEFRYIAVPEFQKRGAVHYHCVFFNLPFVDSVYDVISSLWSNGFVFVQSVSSFQHLSNYISKYFTKDSMDSRLNGRRSYFCSRGLFRPDVYLGSDSVNRLLSIYGLPSSSQFFTSVINGHSVDIIYRYYKLSDV